MGRSIVSSMKVRPKADSAGFSITKLEAALNKGYLLMSRESEFKTKKSFAPSSIGYQHGTCPRYWYLAFTGVHFEENPDAVSMATMGHGTAAHERLQKAFEKSGIVKSMEEEARLEDPPVRGFIDLVVTIDGEDVVGEIKTTGSEAFRYRATTSKPAAYHLYQILIYMHIKKINKGFLLYEDRDTLTIHVIVIEMDEANRERLDKALSWMKQVHDNFKNGGEIPKAPWTRRNKACRFCPLFDACWEGGLPVGSPEIGAMEVIKP